MATTTNFGWETPDDTDLVKDGALAMRTLGNAIDTSLVDLKGGTTGQILSKTSNTDMDFTWITNDVGDITSVVAGVGMTGGGTSGAVTLTNDMASTITASGDIVVGTGSGTYDNLPIGTTGQVLTADTTVSPYKVKWASPAGGGKVLQVVSGTYSTVASSSSTTYADTGLSLSITPTSSSSKVLCLVVQAGCSKDNGNSENALKLRLMRDSTSVYEPMNRGYWTGGDGNLRQFTVTMNYLDSPATTSAVTYKTQFANYTGAASVRVQVDSMPSSIILLEIGA